VPKFELAHHLFQHDRLIVHFLARRRAFLGRGAVVTDHIGQFGNAVVDRVDGVTLFLGSFRNPVKQRARRVDTLRNGIEKGERVRDKPVPKL
jgi:hypothetical protein